MFKNYILIVLRNIEKYKGYSFINIFGLSLGLTCSVLLLLYINYEFSYDRYHRQSEQIYRIATNANIKDDYFSLATTPAPLGPVLKKEFKETIAFTRIVDMKREMVMVGDNQFFENDFYYADPGVFKMFDFPLYSGDPNSCLNRKDAIVLSKSLAEKYFGVADVVGKTIYFGGNREPLLVTGVLKDVKPNSHFVPSAFISYRHLPQERSKNWVNFNDYTYILFPKDYIVSAFLPNLEIVYKDYMEELFYQFNSSASFFLQPLTDIHLYSKLQPEITIGGDISYIYIFSAIALFMIIIASINYMNLATARSVKRAKEVGLRKVVGSYKTQLIKQFIVESVIFTIIAMVVSLIAIKYLVKPFTNISGRAIDLSILTSPDILLTLVGVVLIVGLMAGSYPAFYLSKLKTVEVLKGKLYGGLGNLSLRKILVITQFGLASIMLIFTWVVYDQLHYLNDKDLGFKDHNLIRVPLHSESLRAKFDNLSKLWATNKNIQIVASGECTPGTGEFMQSGIYLESSQGQMQERLLLNFNIDQHYLASLGIELIEGRNFSTKYVTDSLDGVIVNQTLVNRMNWKKPLGKRVEILVDKDLGIRKAQVVGVIRDFHVRSLHEKIEPMVLTFNTHNQFMLVKISGRQMKETLNFMHEIWDKQIAGMPFDYSFVDEDLKKYYIEDERKGKIFAVFSAVTILIACLGLFGLVSFTASQRKKEISIRKVNGATFSDIIILVAKDYLILIGISILIAWPFAYYFIKNWLQNFAYSVSIKPETFLLTGVVTIFITILTISFHATKAAFANPINPLKVE